MHKRLDKEKPLDPRRQSAAPIPFKPPQNIAPEDNPLTCVRMEQDLARKQSHRELCMLWKCSPVMHHRSANALCNQSNSQYTTRSRPNGTPASR